MLGAKVFGITAGVLLIALVVVFNMLLASNEKRGKLSAELQEAVDVNAGNQEVISALEQERRDMQVAVEAERLRAEAAIEGMIVSQSKLEEEKRESRVRLSQIRSELTREERDCADALIPAAYFVREPARSDHGNADR